MEDAVDSKPIVDAPREADTSTPEAFVAVSKGRAAPESDDVQRGSNQPRTAWMVNSAILALNEPRGSSIQAIKMYMAKNYNVDTKKKALFIKKYLISAVDAGVLHRTRGAGAAGSFQVRKFNAPKRKPKTATKTAVAEQKPEAAMKKPAAKTQATTDKNLPEAFGKQTAADKKIAEVVRKQIAADKKLAEAVKKQAAANKKLAGAMRKLAAATRRATAQKAAASVVGETNVNKESVADPPNAQDCDQPMRALAILDA